MKKADFLLDLPVYGTKRIGYGHSVSSGCRAQEGCPAEEGACGRNGRRAAETISVQVHRPQLIRPDRRSQTGYGLHSDKGQGDEGGCHRKEATQRLDQ